MCCQKFFSRQIVQNTGSTFFRQKQLSQQFWVDFSPKMEPVIGNILVNVSSKTKYRNPKFYGQILLSALTFPSYCGLNLRKTVQCWIRKPIPKHSVCSAMHCVSQTNFGYWAFTGSQTSSLELSAGRRQTAAVATCSRFALSLKMFFTWSVQQKHSVDLSPFRLQGNTVFMIDEDPHVNRQYFLQRFDAFVCGSGTDCTGTRHIVAVVANIQTPFEDIPFLPKLSYHRFCNRHNYHQCTCIHVERLLFFFLCVPWTSS